MTDAPPGIPTEREGPVPVTFEQALRDATASSPSHGFGPGEATVPDLRRALASRFSGDEFDDGRRRLRREGALELKPHGHPEYLSASELQDSLRDGDSVLYLLRWVK
jgi:hypothetical protein